MDGQSAPAGVGEVHPMNSYTTPCAHGHMRKRQRSNPGPDAAPYDDVLGGASWRYSPVSDPDIDYNVQSSKRYLSEVMANNLTRHMNLRPSSSPGMMPSPVAGNLGSPGDDLLAHTPPHVALPALPPLGQLPQPFSLPHPHGSAPMTPPSGCSPQRTCLSEMSEGLGDPAGGEILQPMNVRDASISQGGAGVAAGGCKAVATPPAESISETADSELLDERERSVSLSGMMWGTGSGAPAAAGVALVASAAGAHGFSGRVPLPPGALSPVSAFGGHCGASSAPHGAGAGSGSSFSTSHCALPWRLSDAAQGAAPVMSPCAVSQQQQQQPMMRNSPYSRGHAGGARGALADMPSSPSDTRFGFLDLRKTALLRSISRRAEENTADGGGAAAAAAITAAMGVFQPSGAAPSAACGGGDGGIMMDSVSPESAAGASTCSGAVMAMATAAVKGSHGGVRGGGGGGCCVRSVVSCSDSGVSDCMSEGCAVSGGGGGATGMELSSSSADGGGGGASGGAGSRRSGSGGGGGVVAGGRLDDPLAAPNEQRQQQQGQQGRQQQQQKGSGEARLEEGAQEHPQHLTAPSSHVYGPALPVDSCVGGGGSGGGGTVNSGAVAGGILVPAFSSSLSSTPVGLTTPPPAQLQLLLQRNRGSATQAPARPPF